MADRVARIMAEWAAARPDVDVSPQAVIARIHRLANHLTDELLPVYREHGLGEGDFDVLATLRRGGAPFARSAGELAESTMVTTGGMTKRLDRLEARGFVTRRAAADDGRGRIVALTDAGRELIDRAFEAHMANEARLLAGRSDAERRALASVLADWLAEFED